MKYILILALTLIGFSASAQSVLVFPSNFDSAAIKKIDALIKAMPTISLGSDLEIIQAPITVGLSAKVTGVKLTYLWEVVSFTGARPVIANSKAAATEASGLTTGAYVFRCTVTDGTGAKVSAIQKVTLK